MFLFSGAGYGSGAGFIAQFCGGRAGQAVFMQKEGILMGTNYGYRTQHWLRHFNSKGCDILLSFIKGGSIKDRRGKVDKILNFINAVRETKMKNQ